MKVPAFDMPLEEIRASLNAVRRPLRVVVLRSRNPFNVGAIIRVAHSFLVREIVLVGTEPYYERAAMGMARYENITEIPDEATFLARARAEGWKLIVFEREVATADVWHAELPEEEDVTAADRLIVESPTETGLIVVRAFAPEPGLMPVAQSVLSRATCKPEPLGG